MTLNKFFNKIRAGKLTETEIHTEMEKRTEGFKCHLLKSIKHDFELQKTTELIANILSDKYVEDMLSAGPKMPLNVNGAIDQEEYQKNLQEAWRKQRADKYEIDQTESEKVLAMMRQSYFKRLLEEKLRKCKDFTQTQSGLQTKIKHEAIPKDFNDLFNDLNSIDFCIDALKQVDPPIIDHNSVYILGSRQKGSMVAWIAVLKKRGKIKSINDSTIAGLLNKRFQRLELGQDGRSLRNTGTSAYTRYFNQLLNYIT